MSKRSKEQRKGAISQADLAKCLEVLEAIVADRGALGEITRETRRALLIAAGRVSRPERSEQRRLAKALRRKDKTSVRAADDALLDGTGIRELRRAPVFVTPGPAPELPAGGADEARVLNEARKCYVCKAEFTELHAFYDQMCPPCGELNWRKRHQTADLRGRTALVTGARVKIGYQAAMKLLRAGARVIVTTRFPHDAAQRYAREPDFEAWGERLLIYGLDLRHTPSVEAFSKHLIANGDRLDFILHNACQTVRRPPGYYAHLMDAELAPLAALPPGARGLMTANEQLVRARPGGRLAAELSQAKLTPEDHMLTGHVELFPAGALDQDLQQIDLRTHNSWRLALADVPTVELLEVMLVNAVAPFVLSAKLKPLMLRNPTGDRQIVNVSAMEGQFYREHKTDKHPHTNMAKAALNMLTRTSSPDYARDGIYMNSVDTGWVTDEDPAHLAARKQEEHRFHPPLDIVDGAARICDPVFTLSKEHGVFFKDYRPIPW